MSEERKQIVVIPVDTLDATVSELRKSGYIPIRCDDASKVRVMLPAPESVSAGDMLMSAMRGISADMGVESRCRNAFFNELFRRMQKTESEHP